METYNEARSSVEKLHDVPNIGLRRLGKVLLELLDHKLDLEVNIHDIMSSKLGLRNGMVALPRPSSIELIRLPNRGG